MTQVKDPPRPGSAKIAMIAVAPLYACRPGGRSAALPAASIWWQRRSGTCATSPCARLEILAGGISSPCEDTRVTASCSTILAVDALMPYRTRARRRCRGDAFEAFAARFRLLVDTASTAVDSPKWLEQLAVTRGIFARDEIRAGEDFQRAQGDVAQVPDRRCHQIEACGQARRFDRLAGKRIAARPRFIAILGAILAGRVLTCVMAPL